MDKIGPSSASITDHVFLFVGPLRACLTHIGPATGALGLFSKAVAISSIIHSRMCIRYRSFWFNHQACRTF